MLLARAILIMMVTVFLVVPIVIIVWQGLGIESISPSSTQSELLIWIEEWWLFCYLSLISVLTICSIVHVIFESMVTLNKLAWITALLFIPSIPIISYWYIHYHNARESDNM